MEHLQHFGLTRDPFSNEPDLRFFFESGSHHDAQRRVERGIRQHKGLTVLTGDGGMGKTLLSRRVLASLEEEVFETTLLTLLPGAADATSILQRFAREIGTDEPANERAELLSQINEQLSIVREDGRHAVLIIDDAQIMEPAVLAELGGLLSLEYEDKRLLSMLLVGSPELDKLVENDASMTPRLDVRVRLQPFDLVNTAAYIKHRLTSVQGLEGLVPPEATETLHKLGRGRPRLINTLADNALFETYLGGRLAIEPMDIERAAADFGIGPDPGTAFSAEHRPVPPPPPLEIAPTAEPTIPAAEPQSFAPVEEVPAFGMDELLATDEPEAALEIPPPTQAVAAPLSSIVMPTPAFSLDENESAAPVAAFDLTSELPVVEDTSVSPTLDLEEGLEAALADFEVQEEPGQPNLGSLSPPPPTTDLSEFEFEPAPMQTPIPGLQLEDAVPSPDTDFLTEIADVEDSDLSVSEHSLPPLSELSESLELTPEVESEGPKAVAQADTEVDPFDFLPPAADLMAEAEALERGSESIAPGPRVEGLDELDFDLEPVSPPPETKAALKKKPVFEMELQNPIQGHDLALETDLGIVEAAELTPLEIDSAEEFDNDLFVELIEE